MKAIDLSRYFHIMSDEGVGKSAGNLRFYTSQLFDGVDLKGKRVLDIGGGKGTFTFYAAVSGASEVVCLEPEADGSSPRITSTFRRCQDQLGIADIARVEHKTFQDFEAPPGTYDVAILHNSVNHLDEPACMRLQHDAEAREKYVALFDKLHDLMVSGGVVIVCDCSNKNFFGSLGLRNPFKPSIEWEKHQTPAVWSDLLQKAGFRVKHVRWSSFSSLRGIGRLFLGNKLASFFLGSHFCLIAER